MNSKKKTKNVVARGRNAESVLDSAIPKHEVNSSIVDEFLHLCEVSDDDRNVSSRKRALRKCEKSPQDEFAPKIGIVIPIYNVVPYLRECLDSVANQTYKNFHAVLVNDGSTDNSKEIALEYVAKDARFTLIDKENGGLSSARNAGIKYFSQSAESSNNNLARSANPLKSFCYFWLLPKAESPLPLNPNLPTRQTQNLTYHNAESTKNPSRIDYIIFLDSDDFWKKDLLEICVRVAESRLDSAKNRLDSAIFKHEANSAIADEFLGFCEANDEDRTLVHRGSEPKQSLKSRCESKFAPPQLAITRPNIIWFGFTPTKQGAKLDPLDAFGFKDITTISPHEWVQRAQQVGIGQFWFSWSGMMDFRFLAEKKLQFLEGALYEDELFGLQVFSQSRAICVLPKKLYNYRIRENSIASSTRKRSLPPFLTHLRAHFSDDNLAWEYACASSFARILIESVALFDGLNDKALAEALKRAFLPTLFARSCDILAFKCDSHLIKARVVGLLKENGCCLSVLNIIAKIPHKRARYAVFLSYFAPRLVWFRIKKRIKALFIAESSLDSAKLRDLRG